MTADRDPAFLTVHDRAPRVLLVDDHPLNREVARLMLEAEGCETAQAPDGLAAVAAAAGQDFDVILMDVRMPGVDGLEATRRIRALDGPRGAVPVVALTADAMPDDVARCHAAGMDEHLPKPISRASLRAAVERALRQTERRAA